MNIKLYHSLKLEWQLKLQPYCHHQTSRLKAIAWEARNKDSKLRFHKFLVFLDARCQSVMIIA